MRKALSPFFFLLGASAVLTSCSSVRFGRLTPYFSYTSEERGSLSEASTDVSADALFAWDSRAIDIVRQKGLPPTVASKLYVTLAVAQRDVIALGEQTGTLNTSSLDDVSKGAVCLVVPAACPDGAPKTEDPLAALVLTRLTERMTGEQAQLKDPVRPQKKGLWAGENPPTPEAGSWLLWQRQPFTFVLPDPPALGSAEDQAQLAAVKDAVTHVTAEQRKQILYWAGSKGSETPGGIWLGIADTMLRAENADLDRAVDVRSSLLMSIADGFIACWHEKFTHWTERPSNRDASIVPVISVPNFPSYPSGHATISAAAADLLSHFYPDDAPQFADMAQTAAQTRIWAGIHYPVDSTQGLVLGHEIAKGILSDH